MGLPVDSFCLIIIGLFILALYLCLQNLEGAADFHLEELEHFLTEWMNNFGIWLVKYMLLGFVCSCRHYHGGKLRINGLQETEEVVLHS